MPSTVLSRGWTVVTTEVTALAVFLTMDDTVTSLALLSPHQQSMMRAPKREGKKCTINVHPLTPFPSPGRTEHATRRTCTMTGTTGHTRSGLQARVPANVDDNTGWQQKPHGRPRTDTSQRQALKPPHPASTPVPAPDVTTKRAGQVVQADRHGQTIRTPVAAAGHTHNHRSSSDSQYTRARNATLPQPTARVRPAASVTCLGRGGMSTAAGQAGPTRAPLPPPAEPLATAQLPHTRGVAGGAGRNRGAGRPARLPTAAEATRGE